MGIAERREREREQLRQDIVVAARDLLLEQGLSGLSMRAIAERIEYSPATIYLYFRDKEELVGDVVRTGFELMEAVVGEELGKLDGGADGAERYGAMGRAYARFAVENPAYFRIMFELPATAGLCEDPPCTQPDTGFDRTVDAVRYAMETGSMRSGDPRRTAVIGWGLIHGLTTLYLSGHLRDDVADVGEFNELIEYAMQTINMGWRPEGSGGEVE